MSKGTGCHQTAAKPLRATAALFVVLVTATATAQAELSLPNWPDLFNANGSLKDVVDDTGAAVSNGVPDYVDIYHGTDAIFVGDNLSNGVATDMSVLLDAEQLADSFVFNYTVAASHDVGNAFVFATTDSQSNLVIYGAVERLGPGPAAENSYVEFEFTQDFVQAIGANQPLRGNRTEGDLRVRLNLTQGILASAELHKWSDTQGYQGVSSISVVGGSACSSDVTGSYQACDAYHASGLFDYQTQFNPWTEPWDMGGNPVVVPEPNALLEFAVNVGQALGANPDFSSIIVRTPEDAILDSFRNLGYWAQAGQ